LEYLITPVGLTGVVCVFLGVACAFLGATCPFPEIVGILRTSPG